MSKMAEFAEGEYVGLPDGKDAVGRVLTTGWKWVHVRRLKDGTLGAYRPSTLKRLREDSDG